MRIDYPAPDDAGRPVVAVKLQECFGWAETPRLVDGRVPVLFHLLSPAGRPLAVTDDLASFWSGPVCAGARGNARPVPEASVAGGPVDGPGHRPDQEPDVVLTRGAAAPTAGMAPRG